MAAEIPDAPPAPGPPPPPGPPPAPAFKAPAPSADAGGGRGALLGAIQAGAKLRKATTNDRSAAPVAGQVLGSAEPPAHVIAPVRPPSPPSPVSDVPDSLALNSATNSNRQSVDWYTSLAADHQRVPTLPAHEEEDEEEAPSPVVPDIAIHEPAKAEAHDDPLQDIDTSSGMSTHSIRFHGE